MLPAKKLSEENKGANEMLIISPRYAIKASMEIHKSICERIWQSSKRRLTFFQLKQALHPVTLAKHDYWLVKSWYGERWKKVFWQLDFSSLTKAYTRRWYCNVVIQASSCPSQEEAWRSWRCWQAFFLIFICELLFVQLSDLFVVFSNGSCLTDFQFMS